MGVSKTSRAASIAVPKPPPVKGEASFQKALKSASDKQAAGVRPEPPAEAPLLDEPLQGKDGLNAKNAEALGPQEAIDSDAGEASVDQALREFEEVSDEDDPFLDEDIKAADGSWMMPTDGKSPVALAPPTAAAAPPAPSEVMQQLVSAMAAEGWVGADIHGRKVVMLNVQCPGRGSVRIRLRKEEAGVSVRVRADNDELSSLLHDHQDQLRDSLAKKGLALTNLEVVN
jgi:flagellar hook-length control protein FliK